MRDKSDFTIQLINKQRDNDAILFLPGPQLDDSTNYEIVYNVTSLTTLRHSAIVIEQMIYMLSLDISLHVSAHTLSVIVRLMPRRFNIRLANNINFDALDQRKYVLFSNENFNCQILTATGVKLIILIKL